MLVVFSVERKDYIPPEKFHCVTVRNQLFFKRVFLCIAKRQIIFNISN